MQLQKSLEQIVQEKYFSERPAQKEPEQSAPAVDPERAQARRERTLKRGGLEDKLRLQLLDSQAQRAQLQAEAVSDPGPEPGTPYDEWARSLPDEKRDALLDALLTARPGLELDDDYEQQEWFESDEQDEEEVYQ